VFVDFNNVADSEYLSVHKEIWVAVVSIAAMVIATASWFWIWERRNAKATFLSSLPKLKSSTRDTEWLEMRNSS